jgi:hypothetical protein
MNEELDPKLLSLFAASREPLSDAVFLAATLSAIEHRLRLRVRYRVAAVIAAIAIAVLLMPWLLAHTSLLFGRIFQVARHTIELATTPWAWLVSVPIGLLLVYRNGLRQLR